MADGTIQASKDWLASTRANVLAWWVPQAAIIAGLLASVPLRAAL